MTAEGLEHLQRVREQLSGDLLKFAILQVENHRDLLIGRPLAVRNTRRAQRLQVAQEAGELRRVRHLAVFQEQLEFGDALRFRGHRQTLHQFRFVQ